MTNVCGLLDRGSEDPDRLAALQGANPYLALDAVGWDPAPMTRPIRCLIQFHAWRLKTNDEGQQYKECDRCGAYRDFTPAAGAS